jgi:tetratricopeptide (TPR) repeat protein
MAEPAKSGTVSFLTTLIPSAEQLKLVQGIEGQLLRRRRNGALGSGAAIALGVLQLAYAAVQKDLLTAQWTPYKIGGLAALLAGVVIYLLVRRTSLLAKESSEPFRYTFWIEPFEEVKDTPGTRFVLGGRDRFKLVDHDLREKLNRQIARLSLLNGDKVKQEAGSEALASHIQIGGTFAIREETPNAWVIHVMPRVRIGGATRPETLAYPVKFPLNPTPVPVAEGAKSDGAVQDDLDSDRYNQLINRVYSSVATEIYKQIRVDMEDKMRLFPTRYMRAVALYNEARDFERSQTIDAYDSALRLYEESRYCFDHRPGAALSRWLTARPLIWHWTAGAQLAEADTRVGYVKCLIFRSILATLSGRARNPLFATIEEVKCALRLLESLHNRMYPNCKIAALPVDRLDILGLEQVDAKNRARTLQCFVSKDKEKATGLHERHRASLCTAYVVSALANSQLEANLEATRHLGRARSVDPSRAETDVLYLLTAAEVEPEINRKLFKLRQAVELEPDFEIAQFRLACFTDMRLRLRNESDETQLAAEAIREYSKVLRINPGNVGALLGKGYLLWLVDNKEAERAFSEGQNLKAIAGQTFVGDLNYSLARIAAENHDFPRSLTLYQQAFAAEPYVGACLPWNDARSVNSYFDYINPETLARFEKLERSTEVPTHPTDCSQRRTLELVRSYVLNELGNACLAFFHRFGDERYLENAIESYHGSIERNPSNPIVYFNLDNAYSWHRTFFGTLPVADLYPDCLERVTRLAPELLSVRNDLAVRKLGKIYDSLEAQRESLNSKEEELAKNTAIASDNRQERSAGTPGLGTEAANLEKERKAFAAAEEDFERELKTTVSCILSPTTLSSFDHSPAGVRKMMDAKVIADRLNREDIDAIKQWIAILLYRTRSREHLEACRMLGEWAFRYCPEDLDTCLRLRSACAHLGQIKPEHGPEMCPYDAYCDHIIRSTVLRWLQMDPVHYIACEYWSKQYSGVSNLLKQHLAEIVRRMTETLEASLPSLDLKRETYYLRLGKIYLASNKADEALKYLRLVDETESKDAVCCEYLGEAYRKVGEDTRALQCYEIADKLRPNWSAGNKLRAFREDLRSARQTLRFGANASKLLPVATTITMEFGLNWLDFVEGKTPNGLSDMLQSAVARMRQDTEDRLGVHIQGINFRDWTIEGERDRYRVSLMQALIGTGAASPQKRFLPRPAPEADALKLEIAVDPVTGDEGYWVPRESWSKMEARLWQVIDYPIRHLEAMLLDHLAELVGHQEVYYYVRSGAPEYSNLLDRSPGEMTALTSVVRGLLAEQTPITPIIPIVESFREARRNRLSLPQTVEKIRSVPEIRTKLKGNDGRHALYRLSGDAELSLGPYLHQDRLVLPKGRASGLVAAVQTVAKNGNHVALVVENAVLRPFVRSMISREVPRLPVLALHELQPALADRVEEQIEWAGVK